MKAYFIRRMLLVIPTLIGITLMVFTISRFAPGGPFEKALQSAAAGADDKGSGDGKTGNLSEDELEDLEEQYGLDKGIMEAYAMWLGGWPKNKFVSKKEFGGKSISVGVDTDLQARFVLKGSDRIVLLERKSKDSTDDYTFKYAEGGGDPTEDGWAVKIESPQDRKERWARREGKEASECPNKYSYRALAYKEKFSGLIQGDLGRSYKYGDSVWSLILGRVPIALYFGVLSTIIIYGTCIPLGIAKAIGHKSWFDNLSSIAVFVGYSIPGYALGALLVIFVGARMGWFPIFGLTSDNFGDLSFWGQVKDLVAHTVLPLICYVISGFAFLTMMMKNNLMENLSSDYVRTAMSKGVTFKKAVIGHAFRNSFIPIATGLGGLITLFIGGSMLVERVFDIQGFGLLQYQAVTSVDIPVIMGTLTVSSFLMLIGNILSDFIVAMVDPRIKFN